MKLAIKVLFLYTAPRACLTVELKSTLTEVSNVAFFRVLIFYFRGDNKNYEYLKVALIS
jgi:hypothetical protein